MGREATRCGCPYDEHNPWCPTLNQPPTERDGLRVGDEVALIGRRGEGPWPVRIVGFLSALDCCMVVEWLGRSPSFDRQNTICRKDVAVTPPARQTS